MIFVPALVQTVVPGSDAFLDHYQVSVSCRCWYYAMTRLSAAPFPPCPWIYRAQVYDAANYSLCARQSLSGTCESHTWELIFLMNERFYLASTDNVFFFLSSVHDRMLLSSIILEPRNFGFDDKVDRLYLSSKRYRLN